MTRTREMPQENQDDENNGQHDFDQRVARVVDRAADQLRAVVNGHDLHALRQPRFDLLESRFHAIDHVQRILSLLASSTMPETTSPVPSRSADAAPDVRSQHDFTDVLDAHRRAALDRPATMSSRSCGDFAYPRPRIMYSAPPNSTQPARRLRCCPCAPRPPRGKSEFRRSAAGSGRRSPGIAERSRPSDATSATPGTAFK